MTNQEIALEVLDGKWGNGQDRRDRITAAGYNYDAVQNIVNQIVWSGELPNSDPDTEPDNALDNNGYNLLEVELDLDRYDGIKIVIKGE